MDPTVSGLFWLELSYCTSFIVFENVIATTAVLTLMLGGVIGAMDNVQSFIGFFMASLSHVVESLKSKDTRNLCAVALTLLLFCLAMW